MSQSWRTLNLIVRSLGFDSLVKISSILADA